MAIQTIPASSAAVSSSSSSVDNSPKLRMRKHQDSFHFFEEQSRNLSDPSLPPDSETETSQQHDEVSNSDSLLYKIVITPLLSISFIISLFLVQRRDRARRAAPANTSFWSTFTVKNWLDPEPYQSPADTTWQNADGAGTKPQWFMRKKHRKMTKLHFEDALEMRGTVMVVLVGVVAVVLGWVVWAGARFYDGMSS